MKHVVLLLFLLFLSKISFSQNFTWARTDASSSNSEILSIALDKSGNLLVAEKRYSGIGVFKYDSLHNLSWIKIISGTIAYTPGIGICADDSGDVYITGYYSVGGLFLDSTMIASNGGGNMFLIKLNSQGIFQWIKHTTGGQCVGRKVNSDAQNNIYVVGNINGDVYFDSIFISTPAHCCFIAKYNSDGELLWVKKTSGASVSGWGIGMKTDPIGNTYITGNFSSWTIYFDSISLQSYGNDDVYIAKIDSSGNWIWAVHAGGPAQDAPYYGEGLALDGKGHLYIKGYFESNTVHFGNITVNNPEKSDFLAKYDTSGNALWVKFTGSWAGLGVSADKTGPYFFNDNGILAHYNSSGTLLWEMNYPAYIHAMAPDQKNDIYLTGYFQDSVRFGDHALTAAYPGKQMYIARLQNPPIYTVEANVVKDLAIQEPLSFNNQQESVAAVLFVFPSPAGDEITVRFSSDNSHNEYAIRICDSSGKNVYSEHGSAALITKQNIFDKKISVSTLSKGIYFIEVQQGNERLEKKFILQ